MQRDHNCGLRRGGPTPAKAERNHDGRSDDDGCGGNDRGEAAAVTLPHRQGGDLQPGLRLLRGAGPSHRRDSGLLVGWKLAFRFWVDPGDRKVFCIMIPGIRVAAGFGL